MLLFLCYRDLSLLFQCYRDLSLLFQCYRDAYRPDTFKYTQMCCKAGLVWSTEDLTCVYPMQAVPGSCKTLECPQDMCPESSCKSIYLSIYLCVLI